MAEATVKVKFEGDDQALVRTLTRLENRLGAVTQDLRKVTIVNRDGATVLQLASDDANAGAILVFNASGRGAALIGGSPEGGLVAVCDAEGLPRGMFCCDSDTRVIANLGELLAEGRRFATVYADPPWRYGNVRTRGAAGRHYSTMALDDIAALPVPQLAGDRAHLHLWATTSHLPAALEVLRAWGFEYKSQLVWCKPGRLGMGNYWRVSHELLLLGVRGGLAFLDHSQSSWVLADRGRHSAKPWAARNRVERVSPGPYLELFGRELVEGWTVFGDQVAEDVLPFGVPA